MASRARNRCEEIIGLIDMALGDRPDVLVPTVLGANALAGANTETVPESAQAIQELNLGPVTPQLHPDIEKHIGYVIDAA